MKLEAPVKPRTTAQALVDQLVIHGVRHVFCVPGESYLPVLDALRDTDIQVTTCRSEGGAAMMADAVGKATGRPGIAFVTRGPGAANAAAGLHIAQHDSTPLILFAGQVDKAWRERGAWQELDFRATFGGMAKLTLELDDPARVGEVVSRAFHTATAGRPGPVVIGMPRDLLDHPSASPDAQPFAANEPAPGAEDLDRLAALLETASSPILIVGGGGWDAQARSAVTAFAERFALPVVTSYRRGSLFDALHSNYAGDLGLQANPKLIARIKASDLIIALGSRLGEVAAQSYTLFDIPEPRTRLVHIHPDAAELGRVYRPMLGMVASPRRFAHALAELAPCETLAWAGQAQAAHADYLAWSEVATPQPGGVNLGEVMVALRRLLPPDAIICNGAGGYAAWLHRFYRFREAGTHIAPTSASMGYGVPASVAMQRLYPQRRVIAIAGDGDFLMNGQEFATATQYALPIVMIVVDNASYGSIRLHQERAFPGREIATDLKNPDFAALARAYGGFGARVETTAQFEPAFQAACESRLPAILHLKVDVEAMTPTLTLTAIRDAALAKAKG